MIGLECISCSSKFLRDAAHHRAVSGPDVVCHDCVVRHLTGRADVYQIAFGIVPFAFAALVDHDETVAWLVRERDTRATRIIPLDEFERQYGVTA